MDMNEHLGVGGAAAKRKRGVPVVRIGFLLLLILAAAGAYYAEPERTRDVVARVWDLIAGHTAGEEGETSGSEKRGAFRLTERQRASVEVETVATRAFVPEGFAEGRIALNEDNNVPVYSPYAGRVMSVAVRAGDKVKKGQVLFSVEATDMVQAQNDYQTATNALTKAREQLRLNKIIADRLQELFQAKAAALKDYQSAQNDLIGAQSDVRSAEATRQAVVNRLRILGKTDEEIAAFGQSGVMSPETQIRSPIDGTVVQRKVGLGQYVTTSSDAAFTVGDLSSVWLVANVRESEIPLVKLGQVVEATVSGFGNRVFQGRVNYMAATLDPATRRLPVRSEIENPDQVLRPEMFARFKIVTGASRTAPAVPEGAVVYEGDRARVWVVGQDGAVESRTVTLGLKDGTMLEVKDGLQPGDAIVTRGALFIDRAASGDRSS
ncbi:efflux RND transporter periplasmic adaptor subunit [Methylobacterium sp. JK268]